MLKPIIKGILRKLLSQGQMIAERLVTPNTKARPERETLRGVLMQALRVGLGPKTIIDVGAAYGHFFRTCFELFPESSYLLVEPLEEYRQYLDGLKNNSPNTVVVYAAATAGPGVVTINVHPDLVGSSLYLEDEDSDVNGYPREVEAVTLDQLIEEHRLLPPYLLKADVQGAELDVLEGAGKTLSETDYVILEGSFFEFFKGGPLFNDVVEFMNGRGFVLYDLFGPMYRLLDEALSQIDTCFVKRDSIFRKHHYYATREQREAQNQQIEVIRRELAGD